MYGTSSSIDDFIKQVQEVDKVCLAGRAIVFKKGLR
jgi:hypothetical protein